MGGWGLSTALAPLRTLTKAHIFLRPLFPPPVPSRHLRRCRLGWLHTMDRAKTRPSRALAQVLENIHPLHEDTRQLELSCTPPRGTA